MLSTATHPRLHGPQACFDRPGRAARAVVTGGFSLFEMATVLVVLGVAAAIVVPRHAAAIDRYRADGSAATLVAWLQRERSAAMASGVHRRFVFDPPGNTCTLYSGSGATTVKLAATDFGQGPYPCRLSFADFDGGSELSFDPLGASPAGGSIVLVRGRHVRTIAVGAGPDPTFQVIASLLP